MFSQAIKAIDNGEDIVIILPEIPWSILHAIKNIGLAWDEVKLKTKNARWKKLCPEMVQNSLQVGKKTTLMRLVN